MSETEDRRLETEDRRQGTEASDRAGKETRKETGIRGRMQKGEFCMQKILLSPSSPPLPPPSPSHFATVVRV